MEFGDCVVPHLFPSCGVQFNYMHFGHRKLNDHICSSFTMDHYIWNACKIVSVLPKHYYHQHLDIVTRQLFYERIEACFLFLPELKTLIIDYLLR